MHTDGQDPQHIPTEKQMDDGWDVVPGPVPAPVPITIGGHHQVLKENIQVVPGPVPAPVPITIGGHHQVLRENIQDAILLWLLSVAKLVLKILTSPITIALASLFLVIIAMYTPSLAVSSIIDRLSPLCSVPLLSVVPICSNFPQSKMQELPFTKLMEVQRRLLPVLEAAGSSTNLALDFKIVEMKISDLNTLVQLSDLNNKEKISSSLHRYEALATTASRHLSRMESNIEGAVSAVLITDDYVIQALEHIEHGEQQKSIISAITSAFVAYPSSRTILIQTFNHMADVMESELAELIKSITAATVTLDRLESKVRDIHFLVSEAQRKTENEQERTLSDLWTVVGGNRAKVARFAGHHSLLSEIGNYHSTAALKVGQALVELEKLENFLKHLRARVATPILPNDPVIPLELHIKNLRKGVEVLTEGKFRAERKEDQVIEQMGNPIKYISLGST